MDSGQPSLPLPQPHLDSGISGRFPESDNLEEFWDNLVQGVDMVTESSGDGAGRRLHADGVPTRKGTLKADLTKFDASFFGVHAKQAERMDPQFRTLHEVTWEAIMDAGVNPVTLRGARVGVFVGATQTQSHYASLKSAAQTSPYDTTGSFGGMAANRISYAFDFKGPSYTVDTLCSSSMLALHNALKAIRTGECDAAVVGGVNVNFHPGMALQIQKSGALSADGKCKSYDADANGYVRSEAIVAIFIQKGSEAHRAYATLLASMTNSDGFTINGISSPSEEDQKNLMRQLYAEANIDVDRIFYVEGHGTGTAAGDPAELNAISSIMLPHRSKGAPPILVGSVKSNMGHSEAASGLCSIAKVVLALQHGIIPANLHYQRANPNIPALLDGKLKVVSENMSIGAASNGSHLIALNSFGFGGSNVHVVLETIQNRGSPTPSAKEDDSQAPDLIFFSGVTEESVRFALEKIQIQDHDRYFKSLLHQIAKVPVPGHNYRGYTILDRQNRSSGTGGGGSETSVQKIQDATSPPPLWYIFSGMGTVYRGMFDDLLAIPSFSASIHICNEILTPFGLNVLELSRSSDDGPINKNMGVLYGAMQIGLIDTMEALGFKPDGMIGHSAGEFSCAYADKCLTREQFLCILHEKDLCVVNCSGGSMAAVGMTWDEALTRCPKGIYPACHNDHKSVTVAGPVEQMKTFVEELSLEGIFARMIDTGGVSYHSPYLGPILPAYEEAARKELAKTSTAKKRSITWISTCLPEGAEGLRPEYETVSVDYLMANIRDPVKFYTASRQIPADATVLEISSHSLFASILRKSLPGSGAVVGLIRRGNGDSRTQLLTNVGKLYQLGYNPDLEALNGEASNAVLPVPVGTRMIAPLIKWDHNHTYEFMDYGFAGSTTDTLVEINIEKEEYAFIKGHRIDGRILFPATGYLELVWAKFASMRGQLQENTRVEFRDVRFENPIIFNESTGHATLEISIASRSGGSFQCSTSEGLVLIKGEIRAMDSDTDPEQPTLTNGNGKAGDDGLTEKGVRLSSEDVYKLTRLASFEYDGIFKGIHSIDFGSNTSKIVWNNNWTALLDTMLQLDILTDENVCIKVPTGISKVAVDPAAFLNHINAKGSNMAHVTFDPPSGLIKCPGVHLQKLKVSIIPRRQDKTKPVVEELRFVPYFDKRPSALSFKHAVKYFTDLVIENCVGNTIRVKEDVDSLEHALTPLILKWIKSQPQKVAEISVKTSQEMGESLTEAWNQEFGSTIKINETTPTSTSSQGQGLDLFVTNSIANLSTATASEASPHFILLHTDEAPVAIATLHGYVRVAEKTLTVHHPPSARKLFILYGRILNSKTPPLVVHVTNERLEWVPKLQTAIQTASEASENCSRVYAVAASQPYSGLVGFMNCLRQEPAGQQVRCIASPNPLPEFDVNAPGATYTHIFEADLVMNVFDEHGQLGSYRHFPISDTTSEPVSEVSSAYVNYDVKGDLSTLKFFESPPIPTEDKPRLCQVAFSALNFRDVMLATGKLRSEAVPGSNGVTSECLLGLEFSGWNQHGERVMGMVESRGLATHIVADPVFTWRVPESWGLQDAATVPVAYSTAYYALVMRGRMQPGDSVLIHSGSGGVGQAAIAVALSMNCTVFTTVGSDAKRKFLQQRFPKLDSLNMASSRSLEFERRIMERTHGRGVDLVLNSLTEAKLDASLRCLAAAGRFLEIGKYDLSANRSLGMEIFLRNISVHGILLDSLFNGAGDRERIRELVQKGIDTGVVNPLASTVYGAQEIEPAFRFMASGKHVGKVLIQMRDETGQVPAAVSAVGRTYFDSTKVYIIIGGLGGFGFELARWMVEQRGCKKLVLVSRTGVKNGYQAWLLGCWTRKGVHVHLSQADLSTSEGAEHLNQEARDQCGGPIGGIFNAAMVLRDKQFKNQTEDAFQDVLTPKLYATMHLDRVTRQRCPELVHFVVFSSFSAGRGVYGQSNYGWANAGMERLCEARRRDGLPGLAIQWGAIGDVGVVHDHMGGNETRMYGLAPQRLTSCLATLDTLLRRSVGAPTAGAVVTSWVLAKLIAGSGDKTMGSSSASQAPSGILPMLCRIIGLSEPPSNRKMCLIDHGLDSLMAVEAKQVLESYFNTQLTTDEVRRLSWEKLEAMEGERKLND